jgi:DNA polymerase III epsilon subunit-like protein
MDNVLFFDTETTGFYRKALPKDDQEQVHVVQLAAILTNSMGESISELSCMIKPFRRKKEGDIYPVKIAEAASAVHGIDEKKADDLGMPYENVLDIFRHMLSKATLLVAHNIQFDTNVLLCEDARYSFDFQAHLSRCLGYCTMLATAGLVKIPSVRGGYKRPKLSEAYRYFFQKDFDNAHDALSDVRACKEVFFQIFLQKYKLGDSILNVCDII